METPRKVLDVDFKCFLCSCNPPVNERIRIFGKSSVDFQGLLKLVEIDVAAYVNASSLFICSKLCYKRLLKIKKLQEELSSLKDTIKGTFPRIRSKRLRPTEPDCQRDDRRSVYVVKSLFQDTGGSVSSTLPSSSPLDKRQTSETFSLEEDEDICIRPTLNLQLTSTPIHFPRPAGEKPKQDPSSSVRISVHYESKTVNKTLSKEYEILGKALAHGPPQRIAKAIFKNLELKKLVIEKVLRLLTSEASSLCSRKEPSLLRKTAKSDIDKFSFSSLCEEWKIKAPIFYSFLMSIAGSKNATWLPSVAVAGSVLLKQRNVQMNATATVLGIMLKTASIEVFNVP